MTALDSAAPATASDPWRGLAVALLDRLWDTTEDAAMTLDAEGVVAEANRSAARIFGRRHDELVGLDAARLFPAHLRRGVEALLGRVRAGETVWRYEIEAQRRDGLPVPVSLSLAPVGGERPLSGEGPFGGERPLGGEGPLGGKGSNGGAVAVLLLARDITERQVAQAELAEIEARLRDSEALARVGRWLWDVRTATVQWSDELHHLVGIEPRQFAGTLDAHVGCTHPDDRERVLAALRRSIAERSTFDEEYRIVRPDGEVRLFSARATPSIGSDGTTVGLRGMAQDVTDRRPTRGGTTTGNPPERPGRSPLSPP
jgi:PAS domain S-box-containing protein